MAYVYKHIRKDNGEVFYIGIGKVKGRHLSHRNRNKFCKHIVNKTELIAEIIEEDLSWVKAGEREQYWIKFYGRKDLKEGNLVNMTNGGDGVSGHSDETKILIGSKSKGRKLSDETKLKISNGVKKTMTPEKIERIRIKQKGKIVSTETKEKMRIISKNNNSHPPSRKGTHHSEETKLKLSLLNKKILY